MNSDQKLTYFGHALNYYMHQNSLMWGRLAHCLSIQVVTIAGAYAAKSVLFTPIILIGGAFLSVSLILMFNRDRQIRDVNSKLLLELAGKLKEDFDDEVKNEFSTKIPPGGYAPYEAGNLFRALLSFIVIVEVLLAVLFLIYPSSLQNL